MSQSPFKKLKPEHQKFIKSISSEEKIKKGKFIFKEGDKAHEFYVIEEGRGSLEFHVPHRGIVVFESLSEGDILGLSWLSEPPRWHFDAIAVSDVKLLVVDARKILHQMDRDPDFGYHIMKIFTPLILKRLHTTRMRLTDLYANPINEGKK